MQYLKKKKLFEIVNRILSFDSKVMLKDCEYRFYRGTEWLRLYDNSYIYEICIMSGGNYLSINQWFYDDELCERVEVSHRILNGFGKREVDI